MYSQRVSEAARLANLLLNCEARLRPLERLALFRLLQVGANLLVQRIVLAAFLDKGQERRRFLPLIQTIRQRLCYQQVGVGELIAVREAFVEVL